MALDFQVGDMWTSDAARKEHTIVAWEREVEVRNKKGEKPTRMRVGGTEFYKEHGIPGVRLKPDLRGELDAQTRKLSPRLRPHDVVLQVCLGGETTWRSVIGLDATQVASLLKTSKSKNAMIVVAPHDEFDKLLLHRRSVKLIKTEQVGTLCPV